MIVVVVFRSMKIGCVFVVFPRKRVTLSPLLLSLQVEHVARLISLPMVGAIAQSQLLCGFIKCGLLFPLPLASCITS